MKPKQQRIAIAEACGWRIKRRDITGFSVWEPGAKLPAQLSNNLENKIPNYTGDLNAMHEAEKMFRNAIYCRYISELCDLAIKDNNCMYMATAAQRAEAFLRTTGKWVES